jgi:hypothetical protein
MTNDKSVFAQQPGLRETLQDFISAFDKGEIELNSQEIDRGEGDQPHPWHEEWIHHARMALSGAALAPGNGAMEAATVSYDYDEKGNIVLPEGAPFDGNPVLVRFAAGWCEARWESHDKDADDGFCWVCLDDSAPQQELDDAKEWMPLPGSATPFPAALDPMTVEACAKAVAEIRQREAGMTDSLHSGLAGASRSDALGDAYDAIIALAGSECTSRTLDPTVLRQLLSDLDITANNFPGGLGDRAAKAIRALCASKPDTSTDKVKP